MSIVKIVSSNFVTTNYVHTDLYAVNTIVHKQKIFAMKHCGAICWKKLELHKIGIS